MLLLEGAPVDPRKLCTRDPVAQVLFQLGGERAPFIAAIVAFFVNVLGIGVGGALISLHYSHASPHFLPIYDARQLLVVVFIYGFVIPLIWFSYIADVGAIPNTFHELQNNGVIREQKPNAEGKREPADLAGYLTSRQGAFNHWLPLVVVLIGTTSAVVLVFQAILSPARDDTFRLGYDASMVWWSANTIYLSAIWAPITFSATYMIIWIVCRRVVMTAIMTRAYQKFRVVPVVLHPDGANGMAPIGNFAMRLLFLIFLGACWISFFIFLPAFFGFPLNLKLDIYLYVIGYVLVIPILLFWPMWSTHRAMVLARVRMLTYAAENINTILLASEYSDDGEASESDAQVSEAEIRRRKFQLITEHVGTWPFARPLLLRNLLSALVPLLPSLLSFAFQNFSKIVTVSFPH